MTIFQITAHIHTLHKHTQQILNESNENCESISTLPFNLKHKSYGTNINENEKNVLQKLRLENPERMIISTFMTLLEINLIASLHLLRMK